MTSMTKHESNSSRRQDVPTSVSIALQWSRLMRVAHDLGLGSAVQTELQTRLLDHLGELPEVAAPVVQPTPQLNQMPAVHKATLGPEKSREGAAAKASIATPVSSEVSVAQLEMKMRHLVEANASWQLMLPYAKQLMILRPTSESYARLVETAFLHGTTVEIEQLLKELIPLQTAFYYRVHPAVRARLVMRLWHERILESLATLLFEEREVEQLMPVERLWVFASLANAKDKSGPFIYFRRYRQQLAAAAVEMSETTGFSSGRLWLTAGDLAFRLGYAEEAREILSQIPANTAEHDEALQLVLSARNDAQDPGRSEYTELLLARSSPRERLELLRRFFDATRKLGGIRDRNRPALNDLLCDTLSWCPADAAADGEIWAELSTVLIQNRDLEGLLPNLYDTFKLYALRFHSPNLDSNLWAGPMRGPVEEPRDLYWHGVALLHQYVSTGTGQESEAALWRARTAIAKAKKDWNQPLPLSWRELHKGVCSWIAKSPYIMEADRIIMLRQLGIAADAEQVLVSDVKEYLDSSERPQASVLSALRRLCADKGQHDLELKVLQKLGGVHHFTNADINRVWQLACQQQKHDLAWRTATVLHARQALSHQVRHSWDISGEKRSQYPFINVNADVIRASLQDLGSAGARLAHSMMVIGPLLPELLGLLDKNIILSKPNAVPSDSVEAEVERHLGEIKWLGKTKRRYRLLSEGQLAAAGMPAFMHLLPVNPWSLLVARLSEQLGINAWDWQLSKLGSHINDLIPRLASRQDLRRHSSKVARWLKDLSPEQRTAWQDIGVLSRTMTDEDAKEALAKFVCRAATIVMPHHWLALTSLQSMRAPVALIWDLEAFILSDTYSEIRQALAIQNRVLVPNALQRLESISARS